MLIRTQDLTGAALDWAVAKCVTATHLYPNRHTTPRIFLAEWDESKHDYSTDWAQGGPILQNHISELIDCADEGWEACCNGTYGATGSTALQAVCKAYVASKLGDEVDVPEELAQTVGGVE